MMLRKALCYSKSFVWLAIMSLTGLPNILHNIQSRTSWQQRCQYLLIVEKWADIVGESVAKQTCPIGVYQKSLQVAVSSPVWSQALAFERVRLLAKINQLLGSTNSFTIADIHFSTAKWATHQQMLQQSKVVTADHPSYLRAKQMPKCPRCDRPALIGEISRWQMCRVCAIEHLFN